jgi:hypothetical protein
VFSSSSDWNGYVDTHWQTLEFIVGNIDIGAASLRGFVLQMLWPVPRVGLADRLALFF